MGWSKIINGLAWFTGMECRWIFVEVHYIERDIDENP